MEKTNNIKFSIIMSIFLIIFCFAITPVTMQNDTFYTIKIGETISNNGIDMQDHYSWHENLEYTYPHWLFDLFTYKIYEIGGFTGIYLMTCILCSILGLSIYLLNYNLSKNNVVSFIVGILTIFLLISFITARAQIVTFTLFVFALFFIEKFVQKPNILYVIGLFIISTLIVNIHVAVWPFFFILFLPHIGEELFVYIGDTFAHSKFNANLTRKKIAKLRKNNAPKEEINKYEKYTETKIAKRKEKLQNSYKISQTRNSNVKWLAVIMLLCILSGFISPLGANTSYTYLLKTMMGNSTSYINEHLPTRLITSPELLVFFMIFYGIFAFTKKKISLSDFFLISGLTLLAIMSRRQVSMLVLFGSFVLLKLIACLITPKECDSDKIVSKIMENPIIFPFILIVIIGIASAQISKNLQSNFVDRTMYPVEATAYIKQNLDYKNIRLFNNYNFGSYLLLNDIPVFVDSRCDLYMPEYNKDCNVFYDTMDTQNCEIYHEETFEKYNITHVLINKDSILNVQISGRTDGKYKEIYSDEYFVLYERINNDI